MKFREKIVAPSELSAWREGLRQVGKKLVVTNGCFDLLHIGHVTYLENARSFGDVLLVGVNGDESVRSLKGDGRPLNTEQDRAGVLAALEAVGAVSIFPETRAAGFLATVQPDVYVKGGDYTLETLDQEERKTVEEAGGRIELISFVPDRSTTRLINAINES